MTAYLLHRYGADLGIHFIYYRFGPFSRDLKYGAVVAKAFDLVVAEERPGWHKVRYVVFTSTEGYAPPNAIGSTPSSEIR